MVDLEGRVAELEKRVNQLEISITKSLSDIKQTLGEIKSALENSNTTGDLKNEMIKKEINANIDKNTARIKNLEDKMKEQEDSKKWLFRLVVGTIITIFLGAIAVYLKIK